MGSADPPWKNGWKIKKRQRAKNSSFLCLCYILRAIRTCRCRERRYADHIFIQIYFRMHHFVVRFSEFSSPEAARGHRPPNQNPADVPGGIRNVPYERQIDKRLAAALFGATNEQFRSQSKISRRRVGGRCTGQTGISIWCCWTRRE